MTNFLLLAATAAAIAMLCGAPAQAGDPPAEGGVAAAVPAPPPGLDPYDPKPMGALIGAMPGGTRTAPGIGSFCADVQSITANTRVPARNVVHETYAAFVKSKPQPEPLETEQLNWFEDDAQQHPRMISCKLKTADHINAVFGQGKAGPEATCRDVNRGTLSQVSASLTAAERATTRFAADTVVFDPDEVMPTGPHWLAPAGLVSVDAGGALHLSSRAFRVDWGDARFASSPPQLRGNHYCHLIAPDYLRRLLTGAVAPPPGG